MKFLGIFLLSFIFSAHAQVILIDPGHGGSDCGAKQFLQSPHSQKTVKICEKDLSLKISKLIKEQLDQKYRVYLTRSFDRELTLQQRSEMADKVKADLFISVHANSSHIKRTSGFETYYLSGHKDKAVAKIESIENQDAEGKELIINKILADLVIERTAPQSKLLAKNIHHYIRKSIAKKHHTRNRGIKPAMFYVLVLSKRPSVLLEPGFLSNGRDRLKLFSDKFQKDYAKGVAKGVEEYFKDLKKYRR